jgi:hypothetical protein
MNYLAKALTIIAICGVTGFSQEPSPDETLSFLRCKTSGLTDENVQYTARQTWAFTTAASLSPDVDQAKLVGTWKAQDLPDGILSLTFARDNHFLIVLQRAKINCRVTGTYKIDDDEVFFKTSTPGDGSCKKLVEADDDWHGWGSISFVSDDELILLSARFKREK